MSDSLNAEIQVVEGIVLAVRGLCLSPDPQVVERAAKRRIIFERELAALKARAAEKQSELSLEAA